LQKRNADLANIGGERFGLQSKRAVEIFFSQVNFLLMEVDIATNDQRVNQRAV
jgi:hypothetical protein